MFLKNILDQEDDALIKEMYSEQKKKSIRGDWSRQVEEDLKVLEIGLSKEDIAEMKKIKFKTLLTRKERLVHLKHT